MAKTKESSAVMLFCDDGFIATGIVPILKKSFGLNAFDALSVSNRATQRGVAVVFTGGEREATAKLEHTNMLYDNAIINGRADLDGVHLRPLDISL